MEKLPYSELDEIISEFAADATIVDDDGFFGAAPTTSIKYSDPMWLVPKEDDWITLLLRY